MRLRQNEAVRLAFFLSDEDDNESPETSVTPTVSVSKNGAAFAATTSSAVEIGDGWYYVDLATTETNTVGPLILKASGSGTNVWLSDYRVCSDLLTTSEIEKIADITLRRNIGSVEVSANGDALTPKSILGMALLTTNSDVSGTTITIKKTDGNALGDITISVDGNGTYIGKTVN